MGTAAKATSVKSAKWEDINLKELSPAKWNYKSKSKETAETVEKIKSSIDEFGMVQNLIVRELENGKLEVVNGNHRLEILKKAKVKDAHCYNLGKVSLEFAKMVAVSTNELRIEPDVFDLAALINSVQKVYSPEQIKAVTPITGKELEAFQKMLEFNFEQYQKGEKSHLAGFKIIQLRVTEKVGERLENQIQRVKVLQGDESDDNSVGVVIACALEDLPDQKVIEYTPNFVPREVVKRKKKNKSENQPSVSA